MRNEGIVIRERSPWEAIDSGILLLRRSGRVYGVWALTLLPCLLLAALIGYRSPWLGILTLWLLKPLLDRVLISGFGAVLVEERLSLKEALRRAFAPSASALFSELTWFRFVPWRLYILPVRILERQRGRGFRERRKVLSSEWIWPATALRFFSMCVEWSAFFGTGMLLQWLFASDVFTRALQADVSLSALPLLVLYAAAMTLSESLHAVSAFTLYINRRIWLEGWDIERSFTAMAARVEAEHCRSFSGRGKTGAARAPALLAALLALTSLSSPPAAAEAHEKLPRELNQRISRDTQQELHRELEDILADPRFQRYEQAERWRWKGGSGWSWEAELPEASFLSTVSRVLARLLPWIVSAALLGVLLLAVSHYGRRWARSFIPRSSPAPSPSPPMQTRPGPSGGPPRRDTSGFSGRALHEWESGSHGEAVSRLYFGAVHLLEKLSGETLPASATEEERCRVFARKGAPSERAINIDRAMLSLFRRTTGIWTAWAYGKRLPADDVFRDVCIHWQQKESS